MDNGYMKTIVLLFWNNLLDKIERKSLCLVKEFSNGVKND